MKYIYESKLIAAHYIFYANVSADQGHIVVGLSDCLYICQQSLNIPVTFDL